MRARTLALIYLCIPYTYSPKHSLCLMFAAFRNRFIIHTPILTTVIGLGQSQTEPNQMKPKEVYKIRGNETDNSI